MEILISIFNKTLYQPLFNALIILYQYLPGNDFGVAVILLTIFIRMVFYPLGAQAIKSQKNLARLEPKLKEIQTKHKNNREQLARATMELYQKEKINPFSGCLPLLIQLPILIALYQVFWKGLQPEQMSYLYGFVAPPGQIDPTFFNALNLSQPSIIFAILAGATQFLQTKMVTPKTSQTKAKAADFFQLFQKQALYFFPLFTAFILLKLPSALGLYWIANNLFSICQQYLIFKHQNA